MLRRTIPNILILYLFTASGFASADEARAQRALAALRQGNLEQSARILAEEKSGDADSIAQMAAALVRQHASFDRDTAEQRDRLLARAQKLLENDHDQLALDTLANASHLAPDRETFLKEEWRRKLVDAAPGLGREAEGKQQWLAAVRI